MANVEETIDISPSVIAELVGFLDAKVGRQNYMYNIQEATKKGDNYMGVVYRIIISPHNKKLKEWRVILKVPPQNTLRREQFFARPGFLREILAYEKFLPLAKEFQKSKGLIADEIFSEYPKYYFALSDEFHEAICMNDLQEDGFYMHDRFEPLSHEHVAYTMGIYGKLHATSLAVKHQNPEKMTSLRNMVDIFVQRKNDQQLNDYFESLKKSALDSLDKEMETDYWDKLKSYFNRGTFYELLLNLLDPKDSEPYSVICHGDCWVNNIMFKKENGKVSDARLIDWQIMRYASPVTDLMYFIMSSTTKEFRAQYLFDMFDIYHAAATLHIKKLGSDPDLLYPRAAFEREFKNKGAVGLLFGMVVLPIMTTKSEDVPDLEKLSEQVSLGQSTDAMEAGFVGAKSTVFVERIKGIVCDSIDWGLI